jgi:ribosomal protein S18 acetylase RimI-like enzyme
MVDRHSPQNRDSEYDPPAGAAAISETDGYDELVAMFIKNGLEFSEEEASGGFPVPTDIVKCWKVTELFAAHDEAAGSPGGNSGTGRLIGGCVLALREDSFIIDGIAMEPEYRKLRLGKKLLGLAVGEAKSRGAGEMFLVARAPGFFRKQGFVTIPRGDAPNFFECFTCPQYNRECFPEVMRLDWRNIL